MAVNVIAKNCMPLMPTTAYGKVRHMLKNGRAIIAGYHPFTIRLKYATTLYTQPLVMGVDPGDEPIRLHTKQKSADSTSA